MFEKQLINILLPLLSLTYLANWSNQIVLIIVHVRHLHLFYISGGYIFYLHQIKPRSNFRQEKLVKIFYIARRKESQAEISSFKVHLNDFFLNFDVRAFFKNN